MTGLPSVKGGSWFRLTLSTADSFKRIGLGQLGKVVEYINQSLDVVDVSTWTGNAKDASFISGQLRLLLDTIRDACQELKGRPGERKGWLDNDIDPNVNKDIPLNPRHCLYRLSQEQRRQCERAYVCECDGLI
jgi:hypothetical protein